MLSEDECFAIGTSNFQNVNVLGLPALDELISTGRVTILGDDKLTGALIQYEQSADNLAQIINFGIDESYDLATKYPGLIRARAYWNEKLGEIQSRYECETQAMRRDQAFLNDFSLNVDAFDAYLRDGVRPWSQELDAVHRLIDARLGLTHQ